MKDTSAIPRLGRRALCSAIFFAAILLSLSLTAAAAGGLEMSTAYPGLTVQAGDELEFSLDFDNSSSTGSSVALSIASIPEGWSGSFEGDGSEISRVYVKSGENSDAASFLVTVPDDAAEGTYSIVLQASGGGMSSSLTLELTVGTEEAGGSALTTEYAQQEGSSGTSFTFNTTIQNSTAQEQSYSFSANAPSGWTVAFRPSGESTQVAAVSVDARSSQAMEVEVTPPNGVEAGEYSIPISAISGTETLSSELTVTITGSYVLELSTPSGLLSFDANAGRQTAVTLTVTNGGNVDLQNITLASSAPEGWTVEFSQSSIDVLEAGATQEITATFTPSESAMSGDYMATLTAENSETSQSVQFRVTVKTQTIWGVVGVLLIAAAACGLAYVFRKYGRR